MSTLPYGGGDNEPLHRPVPLMVISTRRAFNSYYLSITEVVDKFSLSRIVGYTNSTKRFDNHRGDRN